MTQKRRRVTAYELADVAQNMRQHRGKWIEIPTNNQRPSNFVGDQRKGRAPAFPPTEFETRSAGGVVYGRYNPPLD